MIGYVEAPQAWFLTQGMARSVGVNLPQAVVDGWLTRGELAELVDRCHRCGKATTCAGWLAHPGIRGELPGYCRNKDGIEALIPGV